MARYDVIEVIGCDDCHLEGIGKCWHPNVPGGAPRSLAMEVSRHVPAPGWCPLRKRPTLVRLRDASEEPGR